jgi:hypothetical protein
MSAFADSPEKDDQAESVALREQISQYFKEGREYDTYQIPAGTRLFKSYRDSLEKWTPDKVFPVRGPAYFGFDEANVSGNYGFAFAYITNEPYELLAIDSKKTLAYLWGLAEGTMRPDVQRVLRVNFGFNPKTLKKQTRYSVEESDFLLVQFLCENKLTGYAGNYIATDGGGKFHPECVICGEQINVRINEAYNVPTDNHPDGISGLSSPLIKHKDIKALLDIRLEQHANEHRKKRKEPDVSSDYETLESKKPREYIENIIRYSANDLVTPVKYNNASYQAMPPIYDSSYKTPVKNLFADYGGSRKRKRTRKQRKRTYKQKKNKSRK